MRVESSLLMPTNLPDASIASRGIMQANLQARVTFAQTLTDAAETTASEHTSAVTGRTSPGESTDRGSRYVPGSDSVGTVTPFGTSRDSETVREIDKIMAQARGWEAYFITHAPSEWFRNAESRAAFAEIYGEKALVTLDWTLTVPVNSDPTWVTKVEVDETGIPIHNAPSISEG